MLSQSAGAAGLLFGLLITCAIHRSMSFCILSPLIHSTSSYRIRNLIDNFGCKMVQEEEDIASTPSMDPNMEKAWRHAKKPLLRIGSKGATATHGNSLRQLLLAHTVVKVKINTQKFGSLESVFAILRDLAEQSGADKDIELLQYRNIENVILVGMPGTAQRIEEGEFPPLPPPPPTLSEQDETVSAQ